MKMKLLMKKQPQVGTAAKRKWLKRRGVNRHVLHLEAENARLKKIIEVHREVGDEAENELLQLYSQLTRRVCSLESELEGANTARQEMECRHKQTIEDLRGALSQARVENKELRRKPLYVRCPHCGFLIKCVG